MEYASFGPLLARCRSAQLANLTGARRALVLGDGDGRFLARLLLRNPTLTADVVDSSKSMLRLLEKRTSGTRLCLHHADALTWQPTGHYDLIVSHFFLDCFFPQQVEQLLDHIVPHALPGAQWVISEFAIPANKWTAPFARALIAVLYKIFSVLTGLPVRTLPDYATALSKRGLMLQEDRRYLGGLLCSQLWSFGKTVPSRRSEHSDGCE